MICKKCHVHVEDGETVCPVCGEALEETAVEMEEAVECAAEETAATEETETVFVEPAEDTEEPAEDAEEAVEELLEEPVPAKKKTWVKVTAIVACAALFLGMVALIWHSINGGWKPRENDVYFKDQYYAEGDKALKAADTVIATVGDKELTNSQFQVFYWMGVYEFLQNYSSYLSYFGLDVTKPLSEQYVEEGGQTWEQYFMEGALNTWHSYQSLLLHAEKEGFTIPSTLLDQIDAVVDSMEIDAVNNGFASGDALVQADMGPSSNMEAYRHYMTIYYGGMSYFESLYSQMDPTMDQISAYYDAHAEKLKTNYGVDKESGKLIDVRHILVMPTGGTKDESGTVTYSDEEWETCKQKAEDYLKQWLDGEATEATFAALASEVTEDPGSKANGGLYTYVYEDQMVPAFNDWCFDESREYGDYDIVKTNYGYHIMFYVNGEEGWIRRAREGLISEMCAEIMQQAEEEFPREVNYKQIVLSKGDLAY